ncbi:DUF6000 family protein, partial [Streptomyces globisporus]|uniref:DUF6000 family protein n=1 Tax=Streptomyces globisporus TaxID=1908 RepID=UPI00345FCBD6
MASGHRTAHHIPICTRHLTVRAVWTNPADRRGPDLAYDQTAAMGALVFIDLNLQVDRAARFLG